MHPCKPYDDEINLTSVPHETMVGKKQRKTITRFKLKKMKETYRWISKLRFRKYLILFLFQQEVKLYKEYNLT